MHTWAISILFPRTDRTRGLLRGKGLGVCVCVNG